MLMVCSSIPFTAFAFGCRRRRSPLNGWPDITAEDAVKSIQTSRCNTAIEDFLGRRRLLDGLAVRGDAGSDHAAAGTDGIESWCPRQQRNLSTAGLGEGEVLQK